MRFRSFILLALSLMLGFTSPAMAVTRASADATGQMVLCVGAQVVTVYTDAEGKPTAAPHICPDCALSDAALGETPCALTPRSLVLAGPFPGMTPRVARAEKAAMPRTRAPPLEPDPLA